MLLLLLLLPPAAAVNLGDALEEQSSLLGVDELERAGRDYLVDAEITPQLDVTKLLKSIFEDGEFAVYGVVKRAVRSCVILLMITLLFGLADGLRTGVGGESYQIIPVAAALSITAVAVNDVFSLVGMGREAIAQMEMFSKALLPTVAMASAAGGAPLAAAAKQLATILFSDFLITLIETLLLPLAFAYIAACTAYAAVGNEGLKRIGGLLKWLVTTILTVVLLAFVAYLNISGVIAGSADAMRVKAAKFTMSNMVPVVGGIISDAAETLLAGASILRNSVGVFGMLAVLSICIVPFLHLGAHYLAYKCTAALTATVTSDGRISALIDGIGTAFGLVLGMAGACAMLLVIALISAVSATVG